MNGYRLLLRFAPKRLRDRHGADMEALFRERLSETRGPIARGHIWCRAALDILKSFPDEWLLHWRRRGRVGVQRERRSLMIGSDIRYAWRSLNHQRFGSLLVVGMLASKDCEGFLRNFAGLARRLIAVPVPGAEKGMTSEGVADIARAVGISATSRDNLAEALEAARKLDLDPPPRILITGSLYLAGEALRELSAQERAARKPKAIGTRDVATKR